MPRKKTATKTAANRSITKAELELVPQKIAPLVLMIRGEKVLLDTDLAELYGVETKDLNRAVKRNGKRFPKDFMFQLTDREWNNLKRQFGTSSSESADNHGETILRRQIFTASHGGRRTPPYAFTEQGVAMLSGVLNSERAIQVNIAIMRTFVKLRGLMAENKMLAQKIERLEKKYDGKFEQVFDAIKRLLTERDDY